VSEKYKKNRNRKERKVLIVNKQFLRV